MPAIRIVRVATALVGALLSLAVDARVSEADAARLSGDLTPTGAERRANADGSIPRWEGGLTAPPVCFKGSGQRYCDPFPQDKPLDTITRKNLGRYEERLTPGQIEMFRRYGGTYRMQVFPTRRTFGNPAYVYEAAKANATSAQLAADGESVAGARSGVPFPIPADGREAIWNHKLRFRDPSLQRWDSQLVVSEQGGIKLTKTREDLLSPYSAAWNDPSVAWDGTLFYLLQVTTQPARRAGAMLLVRASMDSVANPRAAWRRLAPSDRWVRWPEAGYDEPGTETDALRTNDQVDTFYGPLDRYEWKLAGKRELYVPANSYELHSDRHRYSDLVRVHHPDPELARYELRRVWVVEAVLKPGARHVYGKRVFYLDEDSWQIRVVDLYDRDGKLWRLQETHTVIAYDKPYEMPVCEAVFDLPSGRYLLQSLNNEDPETQSVTFEPRHFSTTEAGSSSTSR